MTTTSSRIRTRTTATADGRTLAVDERGPADAPAVVFLHSAPGSRCFDPDPAATEAEAVAIATALATRGDLPFGPDGRSALTKVLAAMPAERRAQAEALTERVWVRAGELGERGAASRTIDEALRRQVVVVLDYLDGEGRRSTRRPVEPMVLASTRGSWYLLAWCRRRRAGRWFRLDRIVAASLTTESFVARDLFDVFGAPPDDAQPISGMPRAVRG